MKEIQRGDRFSPAYEGQLSELFDRVEFTPYKAYNDSVPGWLYLDTLDLCRNDRGWFRIRMTEELARVMQTRSIYSTHPAFAHQDHYLKLLKRGDGKVFLYMQFQTILGFYNLLELDEETVRNLQAVLDVAKKEATHDH